MNSGPNPFRPLVIHPRPGPKTRMRLEYKKSKGGFPIRKSSDQSLFAAPQGLSQRTTSFIASQRQGIHRMLLLHLITLMIDVRLPAGKSDQKNDRSPDLGPDHDRKELMGTFPPQNICLPDASGRNPCGGRARHPAFSRTTRVNRMHHLFTMSNIRSRSHGAATNYTLQPDRPHPHTGGRPQGHALNSKAGHSRNGGARRDRTDDLKLAKLPLSQLSYGPFWVGLKRRRPRQSQNGGPGTTRTSDLTLIRGAL